MKSPVLPSAFRRGFTLIELLVVIAIIALLAAILFPVFARARENARKSSCLNNLKQMGVGFAQYTQDFDEHYPRSKMGGYIYPGTTAATGINPEAPWQFLILPYTKSTQIYKCPSNGHTGRTGWSWNGTDDIIFEHYLSNGVNGTSGTLGGGQPVGRDTGRPISDLRAAANVILVGECRDRSNADPEFWDNTADAQFFSHLGQSNWLFCDGHVKSLKPSQTARPGNNMWDIQNRDANAFWQQHMNDETKTLESK